MGPPRDASSFWCCYPRTWLRSCLVVEGAYSGIVGESPSGRGWLELCGDRPGRWSFQDGVCHQMTFCGYDHIIDRGHVLGWGDISILIFHGCICVLWQQ